MMKWIKRILLILVAAFVVYYVYTEPVAAGEAVKRFFSTVGKAWNSGKTFFATIVS